MCSSCLPWPSVSLCQYILFDSLEPCQCVIWTSCSKRFGFGDCRSALYSPTISFPSLSTRQLVEGTLWLLSIGQPCRETRGCLPSAFLDIWSSVFNSKVSTPLRHLSYAVGTLTTGVTYDIDVSTFTLFYRRKEE